MLSQMGYQRPHPWYPSFACDDNPLTHVIGISIYALLRARFFFCNLMGPDDQSILCVKVNKNAKRHPAILTKQALLFKDLLSGHAKASFCGT